jgi:hypothetical protein
MLLRRRNDVFDSLPIFFWRREKSPKPEVQLIKKTISAHEAAIGVDFLYLLPNRSSKSHSDQTSNLFNKPFAERAMENELSKYS